MRAYLFASAAIALMIAGPAYAANPPDRGDGKAMIHKDDRAAAPATPVIQDDGAAANVIILDPNGLNALPNPYGNPGPRLISDVWAMRT